MAIMHPRELSDKALSSPGQQAEVKFFQKLSHSKSVSEDFEVWYRCVVDGAAEVFERPIDFVIGHRKYGILCVEVKGGDIKLREDGVWMQSPRGRNAFQPLDKSPHGQAKAAARIFAQRLNALTGVFIPVNYCAMFPSVYRSQFERENPKPEHATLFQSDFINLQEKIVALMPKIKKGFSGAWSASVADPLATIRPHLRFNVE